MRPALLCTAALLWPGLALAQMCPASAEPPAGAAPAARVEPARGDRNVYPTIGQPEIQRSKVLQRLAGQWETLLDMGTVDGVRLVFAYKGDSMQVFHVLPGGRHVVRGGRMLDSNATDPGAADLTMARARRIPGVVPQVEMTAEATQTVAGAQDGNAVLTKLDTAAFGTLGPAGAPRLWMIFDPLCPFSKRAIEQLAPAAEAGKVQIALLPVPMLDRPPENRSSEAAAQLLALPAGQMAAAWQDRLRGMMLPQATDEARSKLQANATLVTGLGVRNSPTFVWRDAAGQPHPQEGAQNLDAVLASLAPPK